ncbi:hypothetical protein SeMB42_g06274 [Synchytrium endobioticum]|uniref:CN hydrolase domain-containing protein n=1 Tax=Synchytrium endobioticum TaxID=286115 RepID=A0A507CDY6_9FUNG|nr:hypothetical protein SeMB42_g06274 [Synchytrium endobioticum]
MLVVIIQSVSNIVRIQACTNPLGTPSQYGTVYGPSSEVCCNNIFETSTDGDGDVIGLEELTNTSRRKNIQDGKLGIAICYDIRFPELAMIAARKGCVAMLGELAATHRKLHLFDIDVAGRLKFTESEVLSAGSALTHVQTDYGKLGIAICYDIRFPELAMIAARKGCVAMLYPGAFNTVTGPLHWELLGRSRALDNQFYVACCSPARDVNFKDYQAYGHSMIVDPMGQVMAETGVVFP